MKSTTRRQPWLRQNIRAVLSRVIDLTCVLAIVFSLSVVYKARESTAGIARAAPAVREPRWAEAVSVASFASNALADDTLVIISDYQCEGCRRLHAMLSEVLLDDIKVSVGIVHYPLSYHTFARPAAIAALCGTSVGAFASVHAGLMDSVHAVDQGVLTFLSPLVPDQVRSHFLRCLADGSMLERLVESERVAEAVGLTGTPTLFLSGWRVRLPDNPKTLRTWLARAHAGAAPY